MAEVIDEKPPAGTGPDPLVAWGLGAFHSALLVAILLALGHAADALDGLGDLDTAVGLALYALLWGLSWWSARRVLAEVPPARVAEPGGMRRALVWGILAGGATGAVFLVVVALVALAPYGLLRGEVVVVVVYFSSLGAAVAAVVGAVMGGLFVLLDVALFRVAGRLAGLPARRT